MEGKYICMGTPRKGFESTTRILPEPLIEIADRPLRYCVSADYIRDHYIDVQTSTKLSSPPYPQDTAHRRLIVGEVLYLCLGGTIAIIIVG